jgi:hypothetical protein
VTPAMPAREDGTRFVRWARRLLVVLVAFDLVGVVLVVIALAIGSPTVAASIIWTSDAATSLLLAGLAVGIYRGLDAGRTWAWWSAAGTCWLVIIAAAANLFVAVAQDASLSLPLDGIAAAIVLTMLPSSDGRPRLAAGDRRVIVIVMGLTLVAVSTPVVAAVAGADELRRVVVTDVVVSVTTDCPTSPNGAPATITADVDWQWSYREPFSAGTDSIIVSWWGPDGHTGVATDYQETEWTAFPVGSGLTAGDRSSNVAVLQPIEIADPSAALGIDLSAQRFAAGHAALRLQRSADVLSGHRKVTVRATYVHGTAWTARSPEVTCAW